ncbi:MAG TPA: HAD family hydrolase [Candidatus Acidoferrum sp.]|nr:HAD family hydrolase [Candidatus Acidoferrum sp.]
MKRAAFLDRDGVINQKPPEGQYVTRWEEMRLLPGVADAITLLTQAGFCVIIVSNQRCVAKGLLTVSELESIHAHMCQELAAKGALITQVYYCPHDNKPACRCRKPAPGLLLTAAREHEIDLQNSWMIGDSEIDVEAGRTAGCRTVRIMNGGAGERSGADLAANTLLDAVRQVLTLEP